MREAAFTKRVESPLPRAAGRRRAVADAGSFLFGDRS